MPFIDDAPAAGLPLLSPAPLDITPPPAPFSRLFDAAMRRDNIVGSITEAATQPPRGAFDPSFDPWAKIGGYEDYARSFIGANNDDDVLHIKARIDKERRDEEALSTGGWRGTVAQLAAGTLDPSNLIPAGGQVRAITRGGRALEGLIRGGAAFGAGSALQETGLQGSQITRPVSESLMNIGSATVLGGILGGAVGSLTRPTIQRLRELGDSAAVGGLVFDRELAANLPGRRPDDVVAEIIDAPMMERAIADTFAAGGDTAKVYDGIRARIERELADGAVVAHVDQGGERVPIVAIDRAGVLTDANGARLRLDEVTSPGHSIEIHAPAPEERLLVDDPLILHQRGELTAARAAEIASLPPEEVARLRAAGVPFDQEMWKVIAENLGKAEASREGGVSVVADQIGYLSAGGTSEREARAVIGRAMQAEASRGGDVARFLDDAYRQRGVAAPTTPGAVAAAAAPAARDTGAQAAALIGKPVPAMPAHRVATAGGQSVEVTPIVVEARDLVASSDAGYDSALQPRQRDRAASQQQVREIASRLDPERLGVSAEADRGAPIIGDDRMVESGNGRVMAIRAAYEENGQVAAAYREFLAKQGVDLAGFDQPVLVRQRTTPMSAKERADFAVAANRAATLQLSAPERAMADARNLTPDMLDLIRNPDNLEAVANRDFVRAFVESLPQAEQGAMTTAEGGLSAEGLGRIRHAILARAYGGTPDGAAILSRIAETTQDEIRSISNALTAAAPQWARLRGDIEAGRVVPEVDLTPELLEAVRRTADLRNRGQSFADFLRQGDAFDVLPPRVEEFMSLFYDVKGTRAAGAPRIADGLKDYAIEANKVSAEPGLDLGIPAVTADELQRRIVERTRGAGETGTLFGRERPDERVGGAGDGAGGAARGTEVRRPGVVEPGAGAGAAGETGAGRGEIGAGRERSAAPEAVTAPERPAAAGVIEQKQQLLDMHNQGVGAAGAPSPPSGVGAVEGGSVGAAKVLDTSLDQETIASALGVEKALVRGSPTLRAGTSPLIETRRVAYELADQPLDLKKNTEGTPTAQSVEGLIKQFRAPLAEAEIGVDEAFVRYRLGRTKRVFDIARLETRDMFGAAQGAMSYGEFREAISHAMRRGDQSSEPEVAAAAKLLREKVFDPLKDRAIAAGLLPEDVEPKTALSYMMRIYDTNKIVAQRGQFSDLVTRWLSSEQAKKDTIRTRVADLLEEHRDLSDRVSRREGQIEGRAQTLRDTEIRREEASRFNAFAYRRAAQMSQPVDQLRADIRGIEAQIAPQLERLEELRAAISAEKDRFPQLREIDAAMYRLIGAGQKLKQGGELVDLVRDSEDVADAINEVRASVRGGIRELSEERTTARQALGTVDLVALEKTRADLGKVIGPYRQELRRLQGELRDEMSRRGGPARGGAVFETEIRRRGNVLAEQASGREAAIDALGERVARDQARIAAIQTELEGLVKSWEGETSRAAKAALAQRAEQEATRTPEQGRLAAADKPVIEAAKAMANADTRLEEIELRDIARQIIDRIIGSPVGRLPYDMEVPHPSGGPPRPDRAAPRGPLAGRSFMIPDELIEPWLENDSRQIARAYNRTMAPDVLLAERFGRTDMEAQFQQIQAGYERLRVGKSEAEQIKLNAAMQSDLRDLAAMRDRIRGTYGLPENPNGLGNRVYHVVRDLNYLRLLGGMTLSAFPDMGRLVMVHGLQRTFGDAIVPMLRDFHEFRLAANEAKLAGTAHDMVLDTRAMSMADMLDDYGRWSKYERGLKGLTEKFGLVSLMAPWNSAMKQIAGVIGQTRTLEAVEALVAGQPLRQAERTRLASLGIGPDMAERIDAMFKAHGQKQDNGSRWANSEAWTDRGAIESFRSALNKEIDSTIVTQGQEVPLWMSRGVGRMIGQFRTFSMASTQRVLMSGLQKRDMATLNGALLMIGLGMSVYALRTMANPKAEPLPDPSTAAGLARWLREGVDISGLTGYLFDIHNMVEKASGGGVGLSRLTGGPLQSRYANRNVLESILGPTSGLISDTGQLIGAATKGEWSAGDSSRVRRMIPSQNLIGMRHLFDAAEHGLNHSLGVREPAPRR